MMVAINMNLMPPKVIKRKVNLQIKGPFRLSKDPRFKRRPNIWKKDESKEKKDFIKVEKGGVHHKKYDNHCRK
jgi:hypothetical protein